jgi:hypothetical protein
MRLRADLESPDWKRRIRTLYDRHRAAKERLEHGRRALLRLLCCAAARGSGPGAQIWHGGLGADMHGALGCVYGVACVGAPQVAAIHAAHPNRMSRG